MLYTTKTTTNQYKNNTKTMEDLITTILLAEQNSPTSTQESNNFNCRVRPIFMGYAELNNLRKFERESNAK